MADFFEGQRVRIIRGLYKSKKMGIYLQKYGAKMCRVRIDGDSQPSRTLRLTSIAPIEEATKATTAAAEEETVTLSRDEYNALLTEIDMMSDALKRLQLKVNNMDK